MEREKVELISRFNDFDELNEMKAFLQEVEAHNASHLLVRLYYDTKACFCSIETAESVTASHPDAAALIQAARKHISQYELFGFMDHGAGFLERSSE